MRWQLSPDSYRSGSDYGESAQHLRATLLYCQRHNLRFRLRTKAGNSEENNSGRMTALAKKKLAKNLVCGHQQRILRACLRQYFVVGKSGSLLGNVEDEVTILPQSADDGAIDALVRYELHAALMG